MILILFTVEAPDPLADELANQGYQVFEAIVISEVLALAEQHPTAAIIVKAEIIGYRVAIVQQHYPAIHLKPDATVKDILWELNLKDTIQ